MVLTANNPSSRQQRRENPQCWCFFPQTELFLWLLLSRCSEPFYSHSSSVFFLLSSLFFVSILFSVFSDASIAAPSPLPSHLLMQPPARIHTQTDAGMQCCNAKYAQADTICREIHIQSQREDGVWLEDFLKTPANGTQRSPSGHPPLWLVLLIRLKPAGLLHTQTHTRHPRSNYWLRMINWCMLYLGRCSPVS